MIPLIVALALSQTVTVQQGKARDGGNSWDVTCTNCSSGGGGVSQVSVDGGIIAAKQNGAWDLTCTIDGGITIKVIRLTKGAVAIGIDAPKGTTVLRMELAARDDSEGDRDSEAA